MDLYDKELLNKLPKKKNGKQYVSNSDLYAEMIKSKEQGKLTDKATAMLVLICKNLNKKLKYEDSEDRKDCIGFAILDCLKYWNRFDPSVGKNPFAYFTSVASNGYAKAWRKLGKFQFPASIMASLSAGNIHSI